MRVTQKTVQQHLECVCGHNEVISDKWVLSKAALKKLGYKLRKCIGSGQTFYFRYAYDQECHGHEPDLDVDNFYYDEIEVTPLLSSKKETV